MNDEFNGVRIEPRALRSKLKAGREIVAIASVGGVAAGFACAHMRESICYPTPTAEITELFVKPAYRRSRVATELLAFLEDQLVQRRVTHIHVLTGMRNEPAKALYARSGYRYDKDEPEILLEKQLAPAPEKPANSARKQGSVYQFRVSLREVEPPVWRLLEVPSRYSLWDLHVAIQDAMGWKDYHLHAFRFQVPGRARPVEVGIPDDDMFPGAEPVLPGWEHSIREFFPSPGSDAEYEYDFGDSWMHDVVLEAVVPRLAGQKYPRCVDGERACPPEDCGGPDGYELMLGVIADPTHDEYESTRTWLGGRFNPEAFDPAKVRFDNPRKRWDIAFVQE